MISTGVFRRILLFLSLVISVLVSNGCRTWSAREERAASAYNLGNYHREANRTEEAISAYREAIKEAPEFHAATFNLALALTESGAALEGLEYLESLRVRDPANLILLRTMGWAAWSAGDTQLSLDYYNEALTIFSADIPALHGKADVLDNATRFDEAAEVRQVILEFDETDKNRLDLANSLRNAGDDAAALVEYRELLVSQPDDLKALVGAALSAGKLDLLKDALEYRRRAANAKGDNEGEHWWEVARLLLIDFGSFEDGLKALENALEAGFDDADAINNLLIDTPPAIRPAVRTLLLEEKDS